MASGDANLGIGPDRYRALNYAAMILEPHEDRSSYIFEFGFKQEADEFYPDNFVIEQGGERKSMETWLVELAAFGGEVTHPEEVAYVMGKFSTKHQMQREKGSSNG